MGKLLKLGGLVALATILAILPLGLPASAQPGCSFQLGFQALRDQIPDIVGDCKEDEHFEDSTGNTLQATTGGLLVWRQVDNRTVFTDGATTWLNGPYGVQSRPNDRRPFAWEGVGPAQAAPPPPAPLRARVVPPTPTPWPARPPLTPGPIAPPPAVPVVVVAPPAPPQTTSCCRFCTTGKPCGNSCINKSYTCRQPSGCACNALDFRREDLMGMLPALFEDANWLKLTDPSSTLPCPKVAQGDDVANDQAPDPLTVGGVPFRAIRAAL